MRILPPDLAEALSGETATLCFAWLLKRREGDVLAFTDHDCAFEAGGHVFEPAASLETTASEQGAGLATGGGEIRGVLDSDRLSERAIRAGLFDGAELRRYRVNWRAPALDFLEDVTILGEIRRVDGRFLAETRLPFLALDEERGRRYTRSCDAELGDARCGVDLSGPPFRLAATITEATAIALRCATLEAAPDGLFARGRIRLLTGSLAGAEAAVRDHPGGGWLRLWQALPLAPEPGDTLLVHAGCDKSLTTCHARFGNAARFRGFPHIPPADAMLAYARPGEGRHLGRPLVP